MDLNEALATLPLIKESEGPLQQNEELGIILRKLERCLIRENKMQPFFFHSILEILKSKPQIFEEDIQWVCELIESWEVKDHEIDSESDDSISNSYTQWLDEDDDEILNNLDLYIKSIETWLNIKTQPSKPQETNPFPGVPGVSKALVAKGIWEGEHQKHKEKYGIYFVTICQ